MKNCIRIVLIALVGINVWSCADQQLENGPSNVNPSEHLALSKSGNVQSLLTPAFTFTTGTSPNTGFYAEAGEDPYTLTADLQVDWGQADLPPENITIGAGYDTLYSHTYPAIDRYHVSITGELDKIIVVGLEAPVDTVDGRELRNLFVYRGHFNSDLRKLDLSNSHRLTSLDLLWLYSLTSIDIPADAPLSYVRIDGIPLTTIQLADLVNRIYTGVTLWNIHTGYFQYYDLPNALSPATLAQLKSLQDDYGWTLVPAIH